MTYKELMEQGWKTKQKIERLKAEYEVIVSDLEKIATYDGALDENNNKYIESNTLRFCLSTTYKTNKKAVDFCKSIERTDLLKETISIDSLRKVCSEDDIVKEQYATKSYARKLSVKMTSEVEINEQII